MSHNRGIDPQKYPGLKTLEERMEFLVLLANLAPSSHNMQPWFFSIQNQTLQVLPNDHLHLLVADPDWREFYISMGTVLGSIELVANAYGLDYQFNSSDNLHAKIGEYVFTDLAPKNQDFTILHALINRHNSRLPFQIKPLPTEFLEKINSYIQGVGEFKLITEDSQKKQVENNVLDSVREAFADKNFCLELAPWVKSSAVKSEEGLPGYNLGMPFLMSLVFPWMIRNLDISNLQVKIHKRMLDNAAVYGIIGSDEETPRKWLEIGRAFIKLSVECEKNNVSIGIMQASIENPVNRKKLQEMLDLSVLPQMFFRLGFCELPHQHSPRRPLNKILR